MPVATCAIDSMALAAAGKAPMMSQECYDQYRAVLVDLHKANTDQHDKAILQLTAGALGLTVTFMSVFAPHPLPVTLPWLATGWTLLVLSMTTMVSSFLTGQSACRRQIALHDKEFLEGVRPPQINRWSTLTIWLNGSSFFLFVAGVVSILVFSWLNLSETLAKPPIADPQAKQTAEPPVKAQPDAPADTSQVAEPAGQQTQGGTPNMTDNTQRPAPLPDPSPPPPPPHPGHGHPAPPPPAVPSRPTPPPDKK